MPWVGSHARRNIDEYNSFIDNLERDIRFSNVELTPSLLTQLIKPELPLIGKELKRKGINFLEGAKKNSGIDDFDNLANDFVQTRVKPFVKESFENPGESDILNRFTGTKVSPLEVRDIINTFSYQMRERLQELYETDFTKFLDNTVGRPKLLSREEFENLTWKRGGPSHIPFESINWDGGVNSVTNRWQMSAFYGTPAPNSQKAFNYLPDKTKVPLIVPSEFEKYKDKITGWMQSWKFNPEYYDDILKAGYYQEPWGMTLEKRKRFPENTKAIYNWVTGGSRPPIRPHPIDEVAIFHPSIIDKNSYESFPVTRLEDGRVARTIPWFEEGKYVAPALLSPFLLRALQREKDDNTR